MKVSKTIDDIRVKSNIKIIQTLIFTGKSLFYSILGFILSHFYPLDDVDGFYYMFARPHKREKPINITGVDKVLLKCDCINGSIINGIRQPSLYSFALSSPPGHKI